MNQWELVESSFRTQYGLTAREIFDLTWREFCVLFNLSFEVSEMTSAAGDFDWNAALDRAVGREPASSRTQMSLEDFMKGQGR